MREVRVLNGHALQVNDVGWSRHSRFLVTAGKDWNVVVWDLEEEVQPVQRKETFRFDCAVWKVGFHPRNR